MKPYTQLLRCFTVPDEKEPSKKKKKRAPKARPLKMTKIERIVRDIGSPWFGPMVVSDCETLTGAHSGQALRFGFFQERGLEYAWIVEDAKKGTLSRQKLDRLRREGLFYNPVACNDAEIETMKRYAATHNLALMTRAEFLRCVFYRRHYVKPSMHETWPTLNIGHNPPFDLGALSERAGLGRGDNYGGLTMTLLEQPMPPRYDPAEAEYAHVPVETRTLIADADVANMTAEAREKLFRDAGETIPENCLNPPHFIADWLAKMKVVFKAFKTRRYPGITVKKIGFGKHKYVVHSDTNQQRNLKFLDTTQLGRALLGPGGSSIKDLLRRLGIKDAVKGKADFSGPITSEFLDYCRADVDATWKIYVALRDLYRQHGVSTAIDMIFSEASLGKGYLTDLGVTPFLKQNKGFDYRVCGAFTEALYGGRSEARVRHEIVEGVLADFKSQYPSVNALMGLQDLMIAERVLPRFGGPNAEAARFLRSVTMDDLKQKETWRRLRGVARIKPEGDILPVRTLYQADDPDEAAPRGSRGGGASSGAAGWAAYDAEDGPTGFPGRPEDHTAVAWNDPDDKAAPRAVNIGVNIVESGPPVFSTFADIVASKLRTGKCPEILETIELVPEGQQAGLKSFKFFGDDRYVIDLTKTDFFTRIIELRIELQAERDKHPKASAEYARLNAMQQAAKLLANAASYGILIEVIVDEHKDRVGTTIYHGFEVARKQARARVIGEDGRDEISGYKVEKPGKWFAPYGALIPAAGRLMLAIAETLAAERGLTHAFCDTDSMFFVRPDDMPRETFLNRVQEIAGPTGWFQSLNPYEGDVPLFALEDVNFKLKDDQSGKTLKGVFEPLYCLAVSAKRYALANFGPDDEIIIRKASAHGLGAMTEPRDYDPAASEHTRADHVAASLGEDGRSYGDICPGRASRLPPDLWRIAFDQFRRGTPEMIDEIIAGLPGMNAPQVSQQTLSTRNAWVAYETLPNKRPFMFFNILPPFRENLSFPDPEISAAVRRTLMTSALYAAKDPDGFKVRSLEEYMALGAGNEGLYSRVDHQFPKEAFDRRFGLRLTTVADQLQGYFHHAEQKSRGRTGRLMRKTLVILDHEYIGKESNHLLYEDIDEDDEIQIEDAANVPIFRKGINADMLASLDLNALAGRAGVPEEALRRALIEERRLARDAMAKVRAAINVSNDGELTVAPASDVVRPEYRRLRTMRDQLNRLSARAAESGQDAYAIIAQEINRLAPAGSAHIEWPSISSSAFRETLNFIIDGRPPRCDAAFLNRLEKAVNAVSGSDRAKDRATERREARRSRDASQRVAKANIMRETRARCAEEKRAAWKDGEVLPSPSLGQAFDGVERPVAVIIACMLLLLIAQISGIEAAIGLAQRRAFARAKDGSKVIETFLKTLAACIDRIAARRKKQRERAVKRRASQSNSGRAWGKVALGAGKLKAAQ